MDAADDVWNRATQGGGDDPGEGDAALAAALAFHNPVMNGGVLHAFEVLSVQELGAAREGFAWLGLTDVSAFLDRTAATLADTDEGDDDAIDALEAAADEEYERLLPDDDADVERAFRARLAERPDAFRPV